MTPIRPEVFAFINSAEAILDQSQVDQLTSDEAHHTAEYLGRLEAIVGQTHAPGQN